jgi:hypothetical protein
MRRPRPGPRDRQPDLRPDGRVRDERARERPPGRNGHGAHRGRPGRRSARRTDWPARRSRRPAATQDDGPRLMAAPRAWSDQPGEVGTDRTREAPGAGRHSPAVPYLPRRGRPTHAAN